MTTGQHLRAARRLYAKSPSHAPYEQVPEAGTHCVVTSFTRTHPWHVCGSQALDSEAYRLFVTFLSPYQCPVTWNAESTTEEVLAVFDEAIRRADDIELGLPGPSRRVTVQPVEQPAVQPVEEPVPPVEVPVEPEKVPA